MKEKLPSGSECFHKSRKAILPNHWKELDGLQNFCSIICNSTQPQNQHISHYRAGKKKKKKLSAIKPSMKRLVDDKTCQQHYILNFTNFFEYYWKRMDTQQLEQALKTPNKWKLVDLTQYKPVGGFGINVYLPNINIKWMRSKHRFAAESTWRRSASEKTSNAITGNHKGSAAESLGKQEKHSHHQHTHRFEGACIWHVFMQSCFLTSISTRRRKLYLMGGDALGRHTQKSFMTVSTLPWPRIHRTH